MRSRSIVAAGDPDSGRDVKLTCTGSIAPVIGNSAPVASNEARQSRRSPGSPVQLVVRRMWAGSQGSGIAGRRSGQNGDCCRRNSWNSRRVTERIRSYLSEPLHDFPGQSRDSFECKGLRNAAALSFLPRSISACLTLEISLGLHHGLETSHVERRVQLVERDRQRSGRQQGGERDAGLPKELDWLDR